MVSKNLYQIHVCDIRYIFVKVKFTLSNVFSWHCFLLKSHFPLIKDTKYRFFDGIVYRELRFITILS